MERNYGAVLRNVHGFTIRQVTNRGKITNEVVICRGKNEVKKYPIKNIDEAVTECTRLAEKSREKRERGLRDAE